MIGGLTHTAASAWASPSCGAAVGGGRGDGSASTVAAADLMTRIIPITANQITADPIIAIDYNKRRK